MTMNRRELLAASGIGIASIAGCYGLSQTRSSESASEDTEDAPADGSSGTSESSEEADQQDNSAGADSEDTTDTEQKQEEEGEQEQKQEQEQQQEQEQEEEQSVPDEDPRSAVEIAEHELVFDEADDPNYDSDELYLHGLIRNAAEHPLRNVRLDGYVFASGEAVGHEYIEYAALEAGGERRFELPFFVENPEQVERYEFEVTAAQWA